MPLKKPFNGSIVKTRSVYNIVVSLLIYNRSLTFTFCKPRYMNFRIMIEQMCIDLNLQVFLVGFRVSIQVKWGWFFHPPRGVIE